MTPSAVTTLLIELVRKIVRASTGSPPPMLLLPKPRAKDSSPFSRMATAAPGMSSAWRSSSNCSANSLYRSAMPSGGGGVALVATGNERWCEEGCNEETCSHADGCPAHSLAFTKKRPSIESALRNDSVGVPWCSVWTRATSKRGSGRRARACSRRRSPASPPRSRCPARAMRARGAYAHDAALNKPPMLCTFMHRSVVHPGRGHPCNAAAPCAQPIRANARADVARAECRCPDAK